MKRTLLFILLLSTLSLISCNGVYHSAVVGNGDTIKKEISASEFSTVDASHAFDIKIVVGNKTSVSVETDENILEYVEVYVKNNNLYLGIENNVNINGTIKATISTPELDKVDLSGACKINVDGINTDKFVIDMSGACKGTFSGMTDKLDIDLSGATKINTIDLKAQDVRVDVSGASKCSIYSSSSIFADASGASKISVYGAPSKVETNISGASAINFK
jgi:Putative auto-transporter adhesin, head GIN domain